MSEAIGKEAFRALVELLPELEAADASFGRHLPPRSEGNHFVIQGFHFSPLGHRFHDVVYANQLVLTDFDWAHWAHGPEGQHFSNTAGSVEAADEMDLRRLLTTIVRQERFAEGSMQGCLESGFVLRIVRRAAALFKEAP
ncbi:MAG: DUF6508 domain-containing protein [Beijerinckiaceae bacterium]